MGLRVVNQPESEVSAPIQIAIRMEGGLVLGTIYCPKDFFQQLKKRVLIPN